MDDRFAAIRESCRNTVRPYVNLPTAVHILCFGSLVNRAGSFVMVFLTIYVSEQMEFGITFATNCFGVFGLGSIVSSIAGGQLADRFGRKPIMLFALFGAAIALFTMSFVRDRHTFIALVFAFSLSVEMYRPAAGAMLGDLVSQQQRPLAFGLMYIAFNLGFAVAAPIGGFFAEHSFALLFWGDALTTACYGLIILVFIRETIPQRGFALSEARTSDRWSESIREISGDVTFLLFSIATVLTSTVFMQAFTTLPVYLKQLGFSEAKVGLLLSTNGILIVLCQIPITVFLNRFNRILIIMFGEFLIAIGFGLTTFAETAPVILLTIAIWTLGEVVQAAFKQSLVADLAPLHMRGRYMGVFSLCHAVGLTIGAPVGGRLLDRWGPQVLWPACFLAVSLSLAIYGYVYIRIQKMESTAPTAT
jgi:predicted MFS family arabinose efflux permease